MALCNWGDYQLWQAFAILASSALAVPVLHGWRSRPWMVALAGAQVAGVTFYFMRTNYFGVWWMLTTIPYVVILLYGTRRLPR